MSNYRKYTSTGGLNPFWVEEQCEARRARERQQEAEECLNYEKAQETMRLEARMEFLKSHSGDPRDLELARIALNGFR